MLSVFATEHGISYPLLSDEGSALIRDIGLLNEQIARENEHWGIPYPGSFLLDENGVVVGKRFFQSHRERETGVAILEQGFGLRSSMHGRQVKASRAGAYGSAAAETDTGESADGESGTSEQHTTELPTSKEIVSVSAHLDSDTYRWYQRLWLTVELDVAEGFHIYGQPIPAGFHPLAIDVTPIEGLEVGSPRYPETRPYRVIGIDESFNVYEGSIAISVPLTFAQKGGDLVVTVQVSYQTCSDTECYPPRAATLSVPVGAADHVARPEGP